MGASRPNNAAVAPDADTLEMTPLAQADTQPTALAGAARTAAATKPSASSRPAELGSKAGEQSAPGADTPNEPAQPTLLSGLGTTSGDSAARRQQSLVAKENLWGERDRLVNAVYLGMIGWGGFLPIDWLLVYRLQQTPPVTLIVRILPLLALFPLLVWLKRRDEPSARLLRLVELSVFGVGALSLGVLAALHQDGIQSFHIAGAVLILLSHGVTLGSSWRRALLPVVTTCLALPATLVAAALVSPRIAAQWRDSHALTNFFLLYSMVFAGALLTLAGGQMIWGLRQKVAEARSIGRYQLRRRLGGGGMGEVWAAYHASLKRDVAVKLMRPRFGNDPVAVERFEREVRSTAELTHPNTVRVFDYGVTEDGIWYYAMELLDAETLDAHVERQGALEPWRALRLCTQAAQALAEAHHRGIVHRDIKPANLLLVDSGGGAEYVKLIDFGIARGSEEGEGLTQTGIVVGTPGYIAPEVAMGASAHPAADVYALGAVLYYLLAGAAPFDQATPSALVLAHLHERPPTPGERSGRTLPADVQAIVMRCLEKRPAQRYANAGELAEALLACGRGA